MSRQTTRRAFLASSAGVALVGCGPEPSTATTATPRGVSHAGFALLEAHPPLPLGAGACEVTPLGSLGPNYLSGMARRSVLVDAAEPGEPMRLVVQILDAHCRPVRGASLEVWHAVAAGGYSTEEPFACRGIADGSDQGVCALETIDPGYEVEEEGAKPLPQHIHMRAWAPGHAETITGFFLSDDPILAFTDLAVPPEAVARVFVDADGVRTAEAVIVLLPALA